MTQLGHSFKNGDYKYVQGFKGKHRHNEQVGAIKRE